MCIISKLYFQISSRLKMLYNHFLVSPMGLSSTKINKLGSIRGSEGGLWMLRSPATIWMLTEAWSQSGSGSLFTNKYSQKTNSIFWRHKLYNSRWHSGLWFKSWETFIHILFPFQFPVHIHNQPWEGKIHALKNQDSNHSSCRFYFKTEICGDMCSKRRLKTPIWITEE